jgi:hypothetical protein
MHNPNRLIPLICEQTARPAPTGLEALCAEIIARHDDAIAAILFYGSCFRKGDAFDGLVDLYVLVDDYRAAYRRPLHAVFNKLLPPNVYYLEVPYNGQTLRAKYTVISVADFQHGTSLDWFHSYIWGRFAQPAGILHVRDAQVAETVHAALAQSVVTFLSRALPLVPEQFDARDIWHQGLLYSYRSELRAERPDKLVRLFDAAPQHYEQMTEAALEFLPHRIDRMPDTDPQRYCALISARKRCGNRWAWRLRFGQGKILSVLRLLKALFTFKGGIDYVLWKIERHSGVTIEVAPRLRRIPLIGIVVIFWKLYRRGAFR